MRREKDEATGYCLALEVGRHLHSGHIRSLLRELITRYGTPRAIRSDTGGEVVTNILREEMVKRGIQMVTTDPGSPWQNGSDESFNDTFRREYLNAEVFASLTEARVVIEQWRCRYNNRRPHSSQHDVRPEKAYLGFRKLSRA